MQVDWGELGVIDWGQHRSKVYVFVAVMAWSRALFVRFTTDMLMLIWLDCHCRAFAFFGGVPNEVLVDNLKTAVASRAGKTVVWNKTYNEFAVAHQFVPKACGRRGLKPRVAWNAWCALCANDSSSAAISAISRVSTARRSCG